MQSTEYKPAPANPMRLHDGAVRETMEFKVGCADDLRSLGKTIELICHYNFISFDLGQFSLEIPGAGPDMQWKLKIGCQCAGSYILYMGMSHSKSLCEYSELPCQVALALAGLST